MDERHVEQHVDDLLDTYALGALERDEVARVETHLAGCPVCRARAALARSTAEQLLLATPPVAPPPSLRARVLGRVREVAEQERRALPAMHPRAPVRQPAVAPHGPFARVLESLLGIEPSAGDDAAERLADLLADPDVRIWEVTGTAEAPQARARLVGAPGGRHAVLVTHGLAPLAADRAYQVWLLRGGQPIPNALFRVTPGGDGRRIVEAPERLGDFEVVAVTPEPSGGSSGPTGPIVLMGNLSA